ncbi:hypothetical protein U1Q18_023429 [Sarracenia purpurea var. burkii]
MVGLGRFVQFLAWGGLCRFDWECCCHGLGVMLPWLFGSAAVQQVLLLIGSAAAMVCADGARSCFLVVMSIQHQSKNTKASNKWFSQLSLDWFGILRVRLVQNLNAKF